MTAPSILPATWDVPRTFRDRLGRKPGRQRAMLADGHLLLVLHAPPKADDVERTGRYFWRQPNGAWTSSELGSGPQALHRHLAEYADLVEKLDRREEEAVSAEDYFAVIDTLAPLHRSARHMHQVLQKAREMLPADRDILDFRDRAYEIERTAELLHGDAKNSLDFTVAKRVEEQSKSSYQMALAAHRLNLLAAFFFPIATLSAVFGVNVAHGLENLRPPLPFLALALVGLACGGLLTLFVTRSAREDAPKGSLCDKYAVTRSGGSSPRVS